MLRPIRIQCVGSSNSDWRKIRFVPDFPERNYCVNRRVPVWIVTKHEAVLELNLTLLHHQMLSGLLRHDEIERMYSLQRTKQKFVWNFVEKLDGMRPLDRTRCRGRILTLKPLTWKIWWASNNASKWQMGFNSAFKGLRKTIWNLWHTKFTRHCKQFRNDKLMQGVSLATEPGISLIILPLMRILQRNLKRTYLIV